MESDKAERVWLNCYRVVWNGGEKLRAKRIIFVRLQFQIYKFAVSFMHERTISYVPYIHVLSYEVNAKDILSATILRTHKKINFRGEFTVIVIKQRHRYNTANADVVLVCSPEFLVCWSKFNVGIELRQYFVSEIVHKAN